MLPKIIHQCWYGDYNEAPTILIVKVGIEHPNWAHRIWNENNTHQLGLNINMLKADYGTWGHVSNVVRLQAIYQWGGIYLDADFDILKPLDPLLEYDAWVPDKIGGHYCIAAFGAIPRHPWVKWQLEQIYKNKAMSAGIMPEITDQSFFQPGSILEGVIIIPTDYFYPYHWNAKPEDRKPTDNTFAIHLWDKSWWTKEDHAAS